MTNLTDNKNNTDGLGDKERITRLETLERVQRDVNHSDDVKFDKIIADIAELKKKADNVEGAFKMAGTIVAGIFAVIGAFIGATGRELWHWFFG